MDDFEGRLAVITGGGTGIGRELARQLARAGCHVAICDVSVEAMTVTQGLALSDAPPGVWVTLHECDVSDEGQVLAFRDAVVLAHGGHPVNLLFNNAGIAGGASLFTTSREEWERTFAVCWYGVYYCTRAFLPLMQAADEGHIVNVSSVNGFWASVPPQNPFSAYSTAKFAVKGFTESLVNDLRLNAPHIGCSLVMPGHVGTSIVSNTRKVLSGAAAEGDLAGSRAILKGAGIAAEAMDEAQVEAALRRMDDGFRDGAPTSAAQAADIILNAVRRRVWRVLVGDDAHRLDASVRRAPDRAYDADFLGARP